ncbi:MerR family DNA-binding transcriptional regulator [Maritalea porphyrae]|jgi:DNA-binding transcriptional MerR regulator|uniref:MerR family transcriptional regulator n=1 Tax=Maritalea porphyrae TaxID=880732 RepID=UPI0022AE74C4|nr:MerR family DNA-binding transcriptional regulator [Maritalea porphyrae]MCZ4271586.1 MerR family DNA-binding transcriptional regulator [Maritalea porphyrae]
MPTNAAGGHVYTIGDLADFFGITHRALRFYEDKGMLKPRRIGQKRLYSNKDRTKLRLILNGKQIGMTIREIQDFLESYELRDGNDGQMRKALAKIRSQRLLLKQRRESIEISLQELERVEKIIAGMVEAGATLDE